MAQIKYSELAANLMPFILANISGQSADAPASSATTVHDFLGPYHTLPTLSAGYVLASPASTAGAPSFRVLALSDFQTPADTRYALSGRLINAGGGLTGGGELTADVTLNVGAGTGITVGADAVNVNEGHAFSWSASHAFGAGLTVSGANTITMGGDVTLSRSAADVLALGANDSVGTSTFTSGFTGTGWRVNYSASTGYSAEFDNLVVRQQMRIYELLIHKIRSGNGSYLFAPGGRVATVTGTGPYTLTFETDHGMAVNDLARAQKFDAGLGGGVYQSNIQVTSITDTKTLVATLSSGAAPAAGFEYVRIGNTTNTSRQGGVYITADDTNAPYIYIYDGVAAFADWQSASKARTQIGKMNGSYGAGASNWGFGVGDYSSNNYLRYADDATGFVFRAGDGALFIDSDGMRMSLPSGSSLLYVPNSSIAWSTTPGTPGTEDIFIRAARSTGGVFPANSLDIYVQDTGAARQATLSIGASNATGGGGASMGFYSRGDGVDEISVVADTITLTGSTVADKINVGTATGAGTGEVRGKNSADALLGWVLDSGNTASQTAAVYFADRGTTKWATGKNASNSYIITESGVSDRMTFAAGGTITATGLMRVSRNSQAFDLVGNDHVYMGWYPDGDGGGRKAYMGFASASDNNLSIINEISGASIAIAPTGTASVLLGSATTHTVGIGTSSPQAKVHIYDTDAGVIHNWRRTGIDGTRVTIVPNGTGDCLQACSVFGIAYDSAGTAWELRGSLKSGVAAGVEQTVQVAGDGVNNIHIKVKTDGQIEVVRTAGANTWSVCMSVWWR